MRITNRFSLLLRWLFFRDRMEKELDEEFRYHLGREIDQNIAAGMIEQDARRQGLRFRVAIEQRKQECRDMRGLNSIDNASQDVRYAVRGLRRSPAFAALAVLVMALGIGANTAVFSVVNGVLLKPLACRDPDRIVTLNTVFKSEKFDVVSLPDFRDWREKSTEFASMACYRSSEEPAKSGPSTEYIRVAGVSSDFFQVLAIEPVMGRLFSAEEQQSGDSAAVPVSDAYSQSHFGGRASALGKTVRIAGQVLTIAGVLPPRFHFPDDSDIWRPLDSVDRNLARSSLCFHAIARMKPAAGLRQSQSQLSSLAAGLAQQYPDSNKERGVRIARMRDGMVSNVRLSLYLLLGG